MNSTDYMYPNNCVLSLSVLLIGHYMLGWIYVCLTFKPYVQLHDKTLFTLAYLLCLLVCLCVAFSFCDDHQFIDVSKCENSSWSSGWWRFRYVAYLGLDRHVPSTLLELWPMYLPCSLSMLLDTLKLLFCLVKGIMVCLVFCPNIMDNGVTIPLHDDALLLLCVMFHLIMLLFK